MTIGAAQQFFLGASKATGGGAAGYQIERSLRFNSSDSAFCSRTPAVAGDRKKWTWSGWVKRGALNGNRQVLFGTGDSGLNNSFEVEFFGDILRISDTGESGGGIDLRTTQVFRDCSAWGHLLVSLDTAQTTASDRANIYWNGVKITTFSTATYPGLSTTCLFNTTAAHGIGRAGVYNAQYLDGCLADIHFIDGQALTPSSFTEVSATTGQLIPKTYTGTFGTNGFWLKFSDNSAATAATLGKDYSGNSNNWTPNNLSVTAGAGNDSLVDTPTSYGTDTGVGGEVRGNYATWNPLISSTNLTNGNLSVVQPSSTPASRYSTVGMSTGKWYWEISVVKYSNTVFGIRTPGGGILETPYDSSGYGMGWRSGGGFFIGGSNTGTGSMSLAAGDVLGLAFDADAGTLRFYKNGTLNNTLTASSTYIGQTWFAGSQDSAGGNSDHDVNFGQRAWAYTAPSNYLPLVDTLLPAPVVAKPNTLFDTILYSGNNSTQSITSLAFNPDMVWSKCRNVGRSHRLSDAIRGSNVDLYTDTTGSDNSYGNGSITAFTANGFNLDNAPSSQYNTSGETYVSWCWDAGTSTVSNTAGSITSQVRANVSAGFSVISYTGNGSGGSTIGHGLGVAPAFAIFKNRSTSSDWQVYHVSLGNANSILLQSTAAAGSSSAFNSTSPTSTVITLGAGTSLNNNGSNHICYAWTPVVGYSNGFSYTGNGSADGSFVYLGFRPRLIMLKRSDSTSNWTLLDTSREGYNVDNDPLYPNLSDAEGTTDLLDITSNGFKLRSTDASVNASAGTYIGFAWAEAPFAYSRAR